MRSSEDFALAMRQGSRAGTTSVVVHLALPDNPPGQQALVGFVVSKAVGGAVVRNRVKRRLRALLAARVGDLPAGSLVVVRALPASAGLSFEQLERDVSSALARAGRRRAVSA